MINRLIRQTSVLLMFVSFSISISIFICNPFEIIDQRFSSSDTDIPTYIKFDELNQPNLTKLNSFFEQYWSVYDKMEDVMVEIIDLNEKVIYTRVEAQKNRRTFDVSELTRDVYFVRCKSNNGVFIKKFIKS